MFFVFLPCTKLLSETGFYCFCTDRGAVPHTASRWGPTMLCQEQGLPAPPSLPGSVIPGPRQKVTQNTLCLSADSWKVMLNDECCWVGLEGSFFLYSFSSPFLSFFCLPRLTGQPLGLILRLVAVRPSQLFLSASLAGPFWPRQDVHSWLWPGRLLGVQHFP